MAIRQSPNRRRANRFPADVIVCVYHRGVRVGEYRTRDVSRGGLGLRPGKVMFWSGTRLEVHLHSSARRRTARRLPAVVRHCSGRGMGLRFRADLLG
jgi:hypothetical protein